MDEQEKWRRELKEHLYPLSNRDVAEFLGRTTAAVHHILNGARRLYRCDYDRLMDLDVQLVLDTFPEINERVKKRIKKIIDEHDKAQAAWKKYF